MDLDLPEINIMTFPESQLRRVVRDLVVVLPMRVSLAVAADDVHLEVAMYVIDRDYHPRARAHEQLKPGDAPYVLQIFSYDMSDEMLALGQTRALHLRESRPSVTDAEVEAVLTAPVTDEEMACMVLGCVRATVDHEVREGVYFRGKRLDDPHAQDVTTTFKFTGDFPAAKR